MNEIHVSPIIAIHAPGRILDCFGWTTTVWEPRHNWYVGQASCDDREDWHILYMPHVTVSSTREGHGKTLELALIDANLPLLVEEAIRKEYQL